MSPTPLLLSLLLTLAAGSPAAMPSAADGPAPVAARAGSTMVVEPSSADLAGGKARLTTTALRRDGARYIGNYQLKVVPYFFKNETGTLSIAVNDSTLGKLIAGLPVSFAGSAATNGAKKRRAVTVKAIPAAAGSPKGTLIMAIATENGELLFRSAYALSGE
jgi:hypothetical protein